MGDRRRTAVAADAARRGSAPPLSTVLARLVSEMFEIMTFLADCRWVRRRYPDRGRAGSVRGLVTTTSAARIANDSLFCEAR
jgi:hypothetical protein